ncbi:hypothetical protein VNI00_001846, partial [Paramarasmius palmivorus]
MIIRVIIIYRSDPRQESIVPVELMPVVYQAAGIAPTLIIVRVGLGKTVESVNQMVSTLHFADNSPNTETRHNGSRFSGIHAVEFQSGRSHSEEAESHKDENLRRRSSEV